MPINKMPPAYIGREQAYIKHEILKTYLQRLFMIVGRSKETVINYVDCFAGPWKEADEKLRDTSIGVSLEQMANCQKSLQADFSRKVTFRALYIEKDPRSFTKLRNFLSESPYISIETECYPGDYTQLLDRIVHWCGEHFTFFFVDPTGWQRVVGARTMSPLLKLRKAEFLINLMYDFANRAVTHESHADDMTDLFGVVPDIEGKSAEERKDILLRLYRNCLNQEYGGRTTFIPVYKPAHNRVLYYLVYLTRNARGIDVFKAEAERMGIVQRVLQRELKLRRQMEQSPTADLFGGEVDMSIADDHLTDNRLMAREYLLARLSKQPLLLDLDKWAEFLEESDLYPSDFQMAAKELVSGGLIRNIDADVKRRRKNIIKPGWPAESERWVLV